MTDAGFDPVLMAADDYEELTLAGLDIRIRIRVPGTATGGSLFLAEEITSPGGGPPLHIHKYQTETFRILRGSYRFRIGERVEEVGEGAVLVVPPGTPHAFRNISDTPSQFLFTLTPAGDGENFFRQLADTLRDRPGDMAAIEETAARFDVSFVGPPL